MRRLLLTSLFSTVSLAALASPVDVSINGTLFQHGSQDVALRFDQGAPLGVKTLAAAAGEFSIKIGASNVFAYCVDIFHTLSLPGTYNIGALTDLLGNTQTGRTKAAQITYLLKTSTVATALASAATQLAVWEITYETGVTGYNLATGNFTETSNAAARAAAQTLLNGVTGKFTLNSGDTTELLTPVNPSNSQKLAYFVGGGGPLVTVDVPEPASFAVLGLGLLGLGALRRRTLG